MIGDWIGDAILIFGAVIIASWTSSFGSAEYFGIYMMAFLIIGSVVGKSILKGLIAIAMGITVAMVGLDPITGQPRWTLGQIELEGGPFVSSCPKHLRYMALRVSRLLRPNRSA